jgi:DNA-binding SARP family transcriptional activator
MLRVLLLGELVVESSGRRVELSGSWRARSLLAWLALNPGSHPRGDIAARFWPDVLDSSARTSLRNGLWALRRALGPDAADAIVATRDRVGLQGAWIDATAFAGHVRAGELQEALALCRGDLLAGLDEDWVLEYRDAHREQLSAVLERMAAEAEAAGDLTGAIARTRARAALDPLAEDAHRALIVRLTRAGDRAGALAAYGRLRERLRRDLGLSASQETRELVLQIREGEAAGERAEGWTPGARFPLPPRLRQPAPAAFVGRERELTLLRSLWADVRASGGTRLALIVGEPGMGKSRLIRELAVEAADAGAIVLYGAADEDLLIPHQHFVEALGHYVASAAPAELRRRAEVRAPDLEPIAPGISDLVEAQPRADGRQESGRYRLFAAVAALLGDLADEAPVLLLLDDLHWADQSTAALLRHVLESRPDMRLLVLATQRPVEAAQSGALAEALQRLTQQHLLDRVALPGLEDADIAALSDSLTGEPLAPELVQAIREEAGGNPFFVQEIVRHLSEADRTDGVRSLRADVPEGVREVVNLRLARLEDACVRLLTLAAVIGIEFELAPLERVSDLQGEDLAAALDEALVAGLVVESADGEHERFAFSHALVRRTLLGHLSRAHRRRIHARVAEALKVSRGDAALLQIAHHLCEALPVADREEALDYATRAADQALSGLAYAEAVDLYTRALATLPADDGRRRILALKRALAYQALFHAVADVRQRDQITTSSGVISPTIS